MYDALCKLPETAYISYRFSLIAFGHVIERYAALPLSLKRGQKGITVALEAIAEASDTNRRAVKRIYDHCAVYFECAKIGGLGSLISLDGKKSE
jgi:hypothetical protein